MKGKKMLSLLSAGTIACAMLAALPVSAAGTAVTGDIDQDGVITGHDTAMISRYLADDAYTLTEEQLKLADINGDGIVKQFIGNRQLKNAICADSALELILRKHFSQRLFDSFNMQQILHGV